MNKHNKRGVIDRENEQFPEKRRVGEGEKCVREIKKYQLSVINK